jgi:uncharacterized protein (TIGR01777 family)
LRIAITGATGMIGRKLTAFLLAQGHQIAVITRRNSYHQQQTSVIVWDPASNDIETKQLEGFDVVIHLAGTNVGEYWSAEHKKSILESRVRSTRLLCESLSALTAKPKLLISASAIGFYGNHPPQEVLDEDSPSGVGFLADVCRQWEEETRPASQAGIRVVHMRLGVVLNRTGGALAKMWVPFQLGIGGVLGNGQQVMSWVALDEIPFCVEHIINNEHMTGAVNVVSPQAVTNAQFTTVLGQVIHRPTFLPVPAFMIRLLFGEMGQNLLLEGAHVIPRRLEESHYQFRFADLKAALTEVIA